MKFVFQKYVVSWLQIVFYRSKTHLRHSSTLETCSEYDFDIKNVFLGWKIRFFLTKITRENDQFFSIGLYSFPSVLYRALYKTIEEIFSKIRRFLTSNRILMFENTSPTLLDTRDVFRIRFRYQKRILGMKIVFWDFLVWACFWVRFSEDDPPPGGGGVDL